MIPQPVSVTHLPGRFSLSAEQSARWNRSDVAAFVEKRVVCDAELGEEGYELMVSPEAVRVSAQTLAGFFYALQTLRQLADEQHTIPCMIVRDWPRFRWRGMHLDVVRHFFSVESIKRYLDMLALHKLNVFHWHLTDDQGWRIEIKRYPKLTEVGAWRVNREDQPWSERAPQGPGERADYGGFYAQEQIADVVSYARARCIEIVPEIEMPAHALAALAAYPELSCTGGPLTVAPGQYWPDTNLFCAGNEQTFVFLENVLSEVADLFPGKFLHIGGDEADTREWARCPRCQCRMKGEHMAGAADLQKYFTRRIGQILRKRSKRLVGWDEILDNDLGQDSVIMAWHGTDAGLAVAKHGYDVVMCPSSHLYFDHYQHDRETEPKAFGGFSPLSKVYSFEPVPEELNQDEARRILGVQANLWTEYIASPDHAEYMALPRMAALAELAWSPPTSRHWPDFTARLANLFTQYDKMQLHYCRHYE